MKIGEKNLKINSLSHFSLHIKFILIRYLSKVNHQFDESIMLSKQKLVFNYH